MSDITRTERTLTRDYRNQAPGSFVRLDANLVETFQLSSCANCHAPVRYNCLRITEPDDANLLRSGLTKAASLPMEGCAFSAHSPFQCRLCYDAWLADKSAGVPDNA